MIDDNYDDDDLDNFNLYCKSDFALFVLNLTLLSM